jgi:hypothetical protein
LKSAELLLCAEGLSGLLETTLAKGALFRFAAKGFSMTPFIKDGDIITVAPLSVSAPGLGKPVAFRHPSSEKVLVHRIVGKKNKYCLIKGDSFNVADGLIAEGDILGCVSKIERKGKDVPFGLGPERYAIAFLSRKGLLRIFFKCRRIIPLSLRRQIVP